MNFKCIIVIVKKDRSQKEKESLYWAGKVWNYFMLNLWDCQHT